MYVQGNFWVYEPPPCMDCGQFYNQNETPNRWDVGRVLIVTVITVDASPNLPLSHLCLLNTSIGILSGYQCSSKQVYILVSNFKKSAPSPLVWPAVSVPSRPFEAGRTEADQYPMTQQAAVLGFFQAWNCAGYTTGACMINAYFIALVCDSPFGESA